MRVVGLIPARLGSKRIPRKNIRALDGHPLIAYTIGPAADCPALDLIVVTTESDLIEAEAAPYLPSHAAIVRRPAWMAADYAADIHWVAHAVSQCQADAYVILRPTSPLRTARGIAHAWEHFRSHQPADSLRDVRPVTEPPQKMWIRATDRHLMPLLPFQGGSAPWHSSPTQSLKTPIVVQTSALEIFWRQTVTNMQSISGTTVLGWQSDEAEGFTVDTPADWDELERRVGSGEWTLPKVSRAGV